MVGRRCHGPRMRWAASPNLILALNTVSISRTTPQSGTQVSLPDIDASTSMVGRVLDYVGEKYGRDKVAWRVDASGTIITKQALKDSARIMGIRLPPSETRFQTPQDREGHGDIWTRETKRGSTRTGTDDPTRTRNATGRRGGHEGRSSDRGARRRHLIGEEPTSIGAFCSNDNLKML